MKRIFLISILLMVSSGAFSDNQETGEAPSPAEVRAALNVIQQFLQSNLAQDGSDEELTQEVLDVTEGLPPPPQPPVVGLVTDGIIESTSGGFLFPDGTLQPTAANDTGISQADADSRYINADGDTLTGVLNVTDTLTSGRAEIGGGNIFLNADGSATFAGGADFAGGAVSFFSDGALSLAGGDIFFGFDGVAEFTQAYFGNGTNVFTPDGMVSFGNGSSVIRPDGSADFAGGALKLYSSGAASFAGEKIWLNSDGTTSFGNGSSMIFPNGMATFASGNIVLGWDGVADFGFGSSRISPDGKATFASGDIVLAADGGVAIGNGSSVIFPNGKATFASGNIVLAADGGADFGFGSSKIFPDGKATFASGDIVLAADGGVAIGNGASVIFPSGKATFAAGNIVLAADGGAAFGNGASVIFPSGSATFGNGSTTINSTGKLSTKVLEIVGGSDIAEPFDIVADGQVSPGMVVVIDPDRPGGLRLADQPYDRRVAGIVSGAGGVNTGLTLSQDGTEATGQYPVALTGRVYAHVDADANGPVQPGDLLTTSSTLGYAMRASHNESLTGAVLGKAITSLESGKGLVLVLVALQ